MRMSKGEDSGVTDVPELNMTPMIDVVFQLIIFFMLVTNLEAEDIEALVVPKASKAEEDKVVQKDRLVVSVAHDDKIRCDDYSIYRHDPAFTRICRKPGHWQLKYKKKAYTEEGLAETLRMAAHTMRDPHDPEISNRPLMIRADARAPWEEVQRILYICVKPEYKVMIWKIELSVEFETPAEEQK